MHAQLHSLHAKIKMIGHFVCYTIFMIKKYDFFQNFLNYLLKKKKEKKKEIKLYFCVYFGFKLKFCVLRFYFSQKSFINKICIISSIITYAAINNFYSPNSDMAFRN